MSGCRTAIMAGPDMAVDTTLTSSPVLSFTLEATGLTGAAAAQLLISDGANAVADVAQHPGRRALTSR
jgi:hypothetical protein